jgi:hypothetical protein
MPMLSEQASPDTQLGIICNKHYVKARFFRKWPDRATSYCVANDGHANVSFFILYQAPGGRMTRTAVREAREFPYVFVLEKRAGQLVMCSALQQPQ